MEDSILEGLENLSKIANSDEMKKSLLEAAEQFNILGFKFQEEWTDETWQVYEDTRKPMSCSGISQKQISKKLVDLQEIAITLARMSRGPGNEKEEKNYLGMIDNEAEEYKKPSDLKREKYERRTCECGIF